MRSIIESLLPTLSKLLYIRDLYRQWLVSFETSSPVVIPFLKGSSTKRFSLKGVNFLLKVR